MKQKVELLAPAGNFECFLAAINAGADAVYLGGEKFGARAYANNFTTEEIIEALKIAHLFSKKIYLTVNTLVKESEIKELVPFMKPLVEAGLDGVIVQDIGVFFTLRENFPKLELHASTQMTITGKYGARFLKEIGATRIVPARELSLEEIREIKFETGLEVETFIHGAMCYGYSGQCLFSSILGGRSGNRGRCAGPCRLPYEVNKNTAYPISLKDMYTLDIIPELIEAGIDSFKIEGRMKSPEYVAGVTAMYRKYIDKYLDNPQDKYQVSKEDENLIRNLYIRSDICNGYYHQHNNKSMVTIHEPGYKGCGDEVLKAIKEKYIEIRKQLSVDAKATIISGEKASLELIYKDIKVLSEGDVVSSAQNRPLLKETIVEKLSKTGNTCFNFNSLEVITDGNAFMPVKALNDLRRDAITLLENEILNRYESKSINYQELECTPKKQKLEEQVFASVYTLEQLEEIVRHDYVSGVYINMDLFLADATKQKTLNLIKNNQKEFYLTFPAILRKRSYKYLSDIAELLKQNIFSGVLVKNMEEYVWLQDNDYDGYIIADYSIYSWNLKSLEVFNKLFTRTTMSVELNKREMLDIRSTEREVVLYSRLPLMYSANCLRKTLDTCINDKTGKVNVYYLKDRQKNTIPVVQNCMHCFNILFNPVIMSLHNQMDSLKKESFDVYRLEFTLENEIETKEILDFYEELICNNNKDGFPLDNYTAGHFKRGVE